MVENEIQELQKGISFIDNSGIKEFHFIWLAILFLKAAKERFIKHFGYYVCINGEAYMRLSLLLLPMESNFSATC